MSSREMFSARVLSLYPSMFPGPLNYSLAGRALKDKRWDLSVLNIREFALDPHKTVDGRPFGGGPGMVLRADVLDRALSAITPKKQQDEPIIVLSPRGPPLDQNRVNKLALGTGLTLICGRFEGIDHRIIDAYGAEEISLGDFVLSGGEIAAIALLDAVVRLLPNVIGTAESLTDESFTDNLLEYPQFTRPQIWGGHTVPDILLSGDHAGIASWRQNESEQLTRERRPDLWARHNKELTSARVKK